MFNGLGPSEDGRLGGDPMGVAFGIGEDLRGPPKDQRVQSTRSECNCTIERRRREAPS
jgi:hypothetical protein